MKIKSDKIIEDVKIIEFDMFKDERGQFSRVFCQKEFETSEVFKPITQINHSVTVEKGSIRGMHYQSPPHNEAKFVRCISGEVLDVVIDIRPKSKTFLKWTGVHLTSKEARMICIPEGFAHGFQTLTENVELIYLHTDFYEPTVEKGIHYLDPLIKIDWPIEITNVSERDSKIDFLTNDFNGIED